jgi:chromosome segregation ATPase
MPTYCATCLKDVQLEFELKTKGLQRKLDEADATVSAIEVEKALLADEAEAKLSAAETEKEQLVEEAGSRLSMVESEKARLEELLQQKEQVVAELQKQLKDNSLELEQALKYRTALEWLEPALKSVKEKLEGLERNQDSISQAVLQLAKEVGESHENGNLLEIFRRFLLPRRNYGASNQ